MPLRFEHIVASFEARVEKPDPRLSSLTFARPDVPADRVAFSGDSPRLDMAPASAMGMRAVLLDRLDIFDRHRGERVRSLWEFVAAVLRRD